MFARLITKGKAVRRRTNETVGEEEEEEVGANALEVSDNAKLVEQFLHPAALRKLSHFVTDNMDLVFEDAHMNLRDWNQEMMALGESFPDLEFHWDQIIGLGKNKNVFVVTGFVATGTHTGKPYAFGPFPPVPTSGIVCRNDPERLVIRFNPSGKIDRVDVLPSSEKTGPQGFYRQLGGFPL